METQWKDMKDTARSKILDPLVRILEPLEDEINNMQIKNRKSIYLLLQACQIFKEVIVLLWINNTLIKMITTNQIAFNQDLLTKAQEKTFIDNSSVHLNQKIRASLFLTKT
jgi:hypothetical protein